MWGVCLRLCEVEIKRHSRKQKENFQGDSNTQFCVWYKEEVYDPFCQGQEEREREEGGWLEVTSKDALVVMATRRTGICSRCSADMTFHHWLTLTHTHVCPLPTAAIGHFSSPAPLLRCVSPAARLLEKSHLWFTGSFSSSIPQSPSASNQVPPAKSCFCFQLVLKWFLTPGEKAAHSDGFLGEKVCFWKLNSTFNRKDPFIPDVCLILRQVQWTLKKKKIYTKNS